MTIKYIPVLQTNDGIVPLPNDRRYTTGTYKTGPKAGQKTYIALYSPVKNFMENPLKYLDWCMFLDEPVLPKTFYRMVEKYGTCFETFTDEEHAEIMSRPNLKFLKFEYSFT